MKKSNVYCVITGLCVFLSLIACKKNSNNENPSDYVLVKKQICEYKNVYNGKLLSNVSQIMSIIGVSSPGLLTYSKEDLYFYDARDSLVRTESYNVNGADEKILSSIVLYSDCKIKSIYLNELKDTISYLLIKKNEKGRVVEEYEKKRMPGDEIVMKEQKITRKYDNGLLSSVFIEDIKNQTTRTQSYTYNSKNDTLFTSLYDENNNLIMKSQKVLFSKGSMIEVIKFFDIGGVDSLFYDNDKVIRMISEFDNNFRSEKFFNYDEYGNIMRMEDFSYEKELSREKIPLN